MRLLTLLSLAASIPLLATAPATAQKAPSDQMLTSIQERSALAPAQQELLGAMDKMHKEMKQEMADPDPDMAWMKSMAAHHGGAIDMSKIIMRHTRNPDVLNQARKTADENERALKAMQAEWNSLIFQASRSPAGSPQLSILTPETRLEQLGLTPPEW